LNEFCVRHEDLYFLEDVQHEICISEWWLNPYPPLRLGVPSPSDQSKKLIEVLVLGSGTCKLWNNRDKLLKKFIGGGPDGETEVGAETRIGHRGPRMSMEAHRRLNLQRICRSDRFNESGVESSDRSGGQKIDYTRVVNQ